MKYKETAPYSEPMILTVEGDVIPLSTVTEKLINLENLTYFKTKLYQDFNTNITSILPYASKNVWGIVKIGGGIEVDSNGVISVTELSWENIKDKPATFPSSTHKHTSAEITDATSDKTPNTIVKRDNTGAIKANVTGDITGNSDTATKLKVKRNINGVPFDGGENIVITADPNAHEHSGAEITSGVVGSSYLPTATKTDKGVVIITDSLQDSDKTKIPTLAVVEEAYNKAIESGKPATSTEVGTVKPGEGLVVDANGKMDITFMTQAEIDEMFNNPMADGSDLGSIIRRDYVPKEDIINNIDIGGSTKVPSMDLLQLVWQVAQNGGAGNATVMSVLRSANRGKNFQSRILAANSTLITSDTGVFFDPMLFIDGELYPKEKYTVNKDAGTITMNTVVSEKVSVNYCILDNYPSEIKFTVTTTNFLMNSKLKNTLQLGDLIQVEGESYAHDGQRHLRLVENTKKLRGVDIGRDGLFLNEVPSSRQNADPTPVGAILPFPGEIIPLGWCICDGREILQADYPDLYKILPTSSDGKKRIPDLRGEFIRGLDNGRGVDSGRLNGSFQNATQLPYIYCHYSGNDSSMVLVTPANVPENYSGNISILDVDQRYALNGPTSYFGLNATTRGGSSSGTSFTVRPRNIAMNYIIKLSNIISSNEVLEASTELNNKIETNKNKIDFNLLATLGMSYGGELNNSSTKTEGVAYYDSATRALYRCLVTNTDTNVSADKYRAITHKGLDDRLQNLSIKNNIEVVASTNIPNGVLQITRTRVGNIAYFTAMATTNGATFERTAVNFIDTYCRYRVLSNTSYAEDGNDFSIGLAGDENNSNNITAGIRRVGVNQPQAMICKIMLICEIL